LHPPGAIGLLSHLGGERPAAASTATHQQSEHETGQNPCALWGREKIQVHHEDEQIRRKAKIDFSPCSYVHVFVVILYVVVAPNDRVQVNFIHHATR
jgi:hypothetical protein